MFLFYSIKIVTILYNIGFTILSNFVNNRILFFILTIQKLLFSLRDFCFFQIIGFFKDVYSHNLLYFFLAKDTYEVSCEPFLMLEPPNEDDYNYCLDSEEGLGDLFGFRI